MNFRKWFNRRVSKTKKPHKGTAFSQLTSENALQQIRPYELNFATLETADSKLRHLELSLVEFPTVREINSIIDSSRDNFVRTFARVLNQQLRDNSLDFQLAILILEPVGKTDEVMGILYRKNAKIIPISITANDTIKQWISEIQNEIDDFRLTTIVFRLQNAGGGASFGYKIKDSSSPYSKASLEQTPVKFIVANAPMGFDSNAAKAERDAFTAQHQKISPVPNAEDFSSLQSLCNNIFVRHTTAEIPIEDAPDFKQFEVLTGFALPPELKVIYQIFQEPGPRIGQYKMLTFDQMLEEWEKVKQIFETWSLEELTEDTQSDGDFTVGVYMHTHRIPIASDGNGNYYGYDLIPGKSGRSGQIVEFGADTNISRLVSLSMFEFLSSFE